MNRSTSSLIALNTLTITLLAGCASSPSRSASTTPSNDQTVDSTLLVQENDQSELAKTPFDNAGDRELVIGSKILHDHVPTYRTPIKEYTLEDIRYELEEMYDFDQQLVEASIASEFGDLAAVDTIREIDRVHAARLKEIVDHIGWPTREMVGLKATQGAYMVIQHANSDVDFQNRCLAAMVDLVEQGRIPASYVALLTDRIRVFQDRPQVFGTQMELVYNDQGLLVALPSTEIEEMENLDDRRALMGMPPHQVFIDAILAAYKASQPEYANPTTPTQLTEELAEVPTTSE